MGAFAFRLPMSKRILLTTFGSLGDLHPYLALAIGLRERGFAPLLATHGVYREKIESEGIAFHPVAPDLNEFGDEKSFTRRAFALHGGAQFLVQTVVAEPIRRTYASLEAATDAHRPDLFVTHPLTFAAPLLAEKRGLPWVSVALAPGSMMSAHDPFVFPQAPFISRLQPLLGAANFGKLLRLMLRVGYGWTNAVRELRVEIGLPRSDADPLFAGASPFGTLALFSSVLGTPQPDWFPNTTQTGFCFYDKLAAGSRLPAEIAAFLATGDAPIVFTLGSAAVMDAGNFFTESAEAARMVGARAILLTGKDPSNVPASLPDGVFAVPYAPFSELFPSCAVLVHQGGVGTTGQSLRAGRPQLIVPHGFDQPDNADRCVRRGVARTVSRYRYTAPAVARELRTLLSDTRYAERAAILGEQVRGENGIVAACDAIE
ncbi:MAG: glycosyltransferase family 1 protein, partial [Armatimonadetes bacterium]|nr:glycosyltransferase family 1 protein [Armatimonadota bacterium]